MEPNFIEQFSNATAQAVARASQSVVTVHAGRRPISGVVVAPQHVLSIDHVLEGDEAQVSFEGQAPLAAQVVGRDPSSDLVLLRVEGLGLEPLEAAPAAQVGQFVLWVARPEALMASQGIVSAVGGPVALHRGLRLERYLRTDAQPYPGFSGGALVDLSGRLVAVGNAGLMRGEGVGIPAAHALETVRALQAGTPRQRPYLGIGSQPIRLPEMAGLSQQVGLLLVSVEPDSPAQRAGLFIGDILLRFAGVALEDTDDLQGQLSSEVVGQSFPVQILRAGALQTLTLEVGSREGTPERGRGPRGAGRGGRR